MECMGLKSTPVVAKLLLGPLTCMGLWLALHEHMASPNSPNGGFSLPLAAHPPPPPLSPTCDISVVVKQLFKIKQC